MPAAAAGAAAGAASEGGGGRFRNFSALQAPEGSAAAALPAVLILGGSTFMGRELVQLLVKRQARVCVVNRGRSYWGTDDPSGGRAARLLADRRDAKGFASLLDEATKRLGQRWDLVADFSAYNGADIRAALDGLQGRFVTYVYISSDSVYEVSAWAGEGWRPRAADVTAEAVAEGDAGRPVDEATRKRLRKADSYGDGKLEAEEALAEGLAAVETCSRGISLRLPDVIGPWDDTLRLWAYWHWLRVADIDPPQVPDERAAKRPRRADADEAQAEAEGAAVEAAVPLAVVFSQDVARFIGERLGAGPIAGAPRCDAVNLACARQPSLQQLLTMLAAASGATNPPPLAATLRPKHFLPSVDRPWPLRCERMAEVYGLRPTPLEDVLKACAAWFAQACADFPKDARRAAGKLPARARQAAIARAGLSDAPRSSSSSNNFSGSSGSGKDSAAEL